VSRRDLKHCILRPGRPADAPSADRTDNDIFCRYGSRRGFARRGSGRGPVEVEICRHAPQGRGFATPERFCRRFSGAAGQEDEHRSGFRHESRDRRQKQDPGLAAAAPRRAGRGRATKRCRYVRGGPLGAEPVAGVASSRYSAAIATPASRMVVEVSPRACSSACRSRARATDRCRVGLRSRKRRPRGRASKRRITSWGHEAQARSGSATPLTGPEGGGSGASAVSTGRAAARLDHIHQVT